MTIETAYLKFLEHVDRNYTNDEMSADRGRFIYVLNEVMRRYVLYKLDHRNSDKVQDIQFLLEEVKLKKTSSEEKYDAFGLPPRFLRESIVFAKSKQCSKDLTLHYVKPENTQEMYFDVHNEPSLLYAETFYNVWGNEVNVYKKGFDVKEVKLLYYREPKKVDIEGYIHEDGSESKNIDPEFTDTSMDVIIEAAALHFNQDNNELEKIQFNERRVFSPI